MVGGFWSHLSYCPPNGGGFCEGNGKSLRVGALSMRAERRCRHSLLCFFCDCSYNAILMVHMMKFHGQIYVAYLGVIEC